MAEFVTYLCCLSVCAPFVFTDLPVSQPAALVPASATTPTSAAMQLGAKKHAFAQFLLGFKRTTAQQDLNMVSPTKDSHLYQVVPIFLTKVKENFVTTPRGGRAAEMFGNNNGGFALGVSEEHDKSTCRAIFDVLFIESGGTLDEDGHVPPDAALDGRQLARAMRHLGHSINRERAEHMIRVEDADGDGESRSSRASHSNHRRCRWLCWGQSCCP